MNDVLLPLLHITDVRTLGPHPSDPTRLCTIENVLSHSQNDVVAIPAADTSKLLDMLDRASARVDENSRKWMTAVGSEHARGLKKPIDTSITGKERMCVMTRGAHSMDELGDHTNFIRNAPETGLFYFESSHPSAVLHCKEIMRMVMYTCALGFLLCFLQVHKNITFAKQFECIFDPIFSEATVQPVTLPCMCFEKKKIAGTSYHIRKEGGGPRTRK